jgi:hypothetical protein
VKEKVLCKRTGQHCCEKEKFRFLMLGSTNRLKIVLEEDIEIREEKLRTALVDEKKWRRRKGLPKRPMKLGKAAPDSLALVPQQY